MFTFALRRLAIAVPTLLVVLTLVFMVVRVAPGDPARAVLGDYASQAAVEALRERMGLDQPLYAQYADFLKGLATGDLGNSMISGVPVARQIGNALPYTVQLTLSGIVLGLVVGIPLGIFTALRRNTAADYLVRTLSLVGLSFPSFFLGILLILLFSVRLGLLPAVGGGDLQDPVSALRHLVLPAVTLGLIMTAYVTRLTRSSVLNVLGEDYIRTARSKGLQQRSVVYKHVLRNAFVPIISIAGIYSIVLTGGSLVVEVVFSRPGLGRLLVGAMLQRDYITLQSVMVIYAVFVVFVNLVTDLAYAVADPNIRYD
ncbi:MAG: ABC transporter permease [Trueperaceae bacterium]|nr:ABC transporter permease [Trueperaceae bacterium]